MREYRFGLLLAVLVLMLVTAPLIRSIRPDEPSLIADVLFVIVFTAVLLSAVFAVSDRPRTTMFALSLAIVTFVLEIIYLATGNRGAFIAQHACSLVFLGWISIVMLGLLFRAQRVTFNMISASLCVYLLLGVAWSVLYSLLYVMNQDSFSYSLASGAPHGKMMFGGQHSDLPLYFSIVTMTTLGYGDIVPATATARMCASMQAFLGQVYLAVLVARLVGMHIAQSHDENRTEDL